MAGRNIYLTTVPPAKAVAKAVNALDRDALVRTETVPVQDSAGRVTAAPVFARCSSPTFHASAMDGVAVRAESTFKAREGRPVRLVLRKDYEPVNTGNLLPEGMDAVIMIEHVLQVDENTIAIEAPAYPWSHVRRIGEDIVATELLLPMNSLISAYDVGALLTAGIWEVEVYERVRAVFIPTGDEVISFLDRPNPKPGQVIESNSQIFKSLAASWGVDARTVKPVPDDKQALIETVRQALDSDAHMVVVGAGSSAGSKDYTREIFESCGRILVHGLGVMPGKPSLLAVADNGKLMAGAPGYPVSSVVFCDDLVAKIASWLGHRPEPERMTVQARLVRRTPSRMGIEEVVRLALGPVGDEYVAVPLGRGAGMITTMTKAQAVTRIPPASEGVEQGETVACELLVPKKTLNRVMVHVGSHDNTLDLLANQLMALPEPLQLVSSHVGSMGGLSALKNGAALLAGCHLFDPETKDFNFPFLATYLPGMEVEAVNLAVRHQGLIVAKGNPKGIFGVQDLAREDVVFVNRQRGAGTRILLDHHMRQAGIYPDAVRGYDREEFTHMAVAVNVLTGVADCGLGIMAAARALGLDFAPLARERYDLIIPKAYMDDERIRTLLAIIRGDGFKKLVEDLGGYETGLTGKIMQPGQGLEE